MKIKTIEEIKIYLICCILSPGILYSVFGFLLSLNYVVIRWGLVTAPDHAPCPKGNH
jgi:hypothetical protein